MPSYYMEQDHSRICVICLEEFVAGDKKTQLPNCTHIVHSSCFFKYINHNLNNRINQVSCPICREVYIDVGNAQHVGGATPVPHLPPPALIALHVDNAVIPELQQEIDNINREEERIRKIIPTILGAITVANLLFLFHLIITHPQ